MRENVFRLLYYIRLGQLLCKFNQSQGRVPILVFHRVTNEYDPYTEPISPAKFEKFILFLKGKYDLRPIQDLFILEPDELKHACFITFDDAMLDFFHNAVPILQKHSIPATLFVPVEPVLSKTQLWNHKFFSFLLFATNKKVKLKLESNVYCFDLTKGFDYENVMALHSLLLAQNVEKRNTYLDSIEKAFLPSMDHKSFASVMPIELLRQISANISFGSHTLSHSFLPSQGEEILERELEEGKDKLESLLEKKINMIAYPNGGIKEEQLCQVKKYFDYGFVVGDKLVNLSKIVGMKYRLKIPRINVNDNTEYELYFRMNELHQKLKKILFFYKQ